jgi:hypothetical protein
MKLYEKLARRARGLLDAGVEGRLAVANIDEWMAGERVKNPPAVTTLMLPGFSDEA